MTLLRKAYKYLHQAFSVRIWLASIVVIFLILLLALTVKNAREKEVADLFSPQQLSSAQNAAARMTAILSQIESNIVLFSQFDPNGNLLSPQAYRDLHLLYPVWGNTVDAVSVFDAEGGAKSVLVRGGGPGVDLTRHFNTLKRQQRQYLNVALADASAGDSSAPKREWYLIWGYPVWRQNNRFAGAWMVSFSLRDFIGAGEQQIKDNRLGDLWLVNERGQILMHPYSPFIGKNAGDLVHDRKDNVINFLSEGGRYHDARVLQRNNKIQRSVVAYYPLQIAGATWFVVVEAPYRSVIAPCAPPFCIRCSARGADHGPGCRRYLLGLAEGKRLRIREEQERLKEREAWQEKLLREKKTIDGIIEGSPIPSFVINKDHRVILWNRACEDLTGHSALDMVGTDRHYIPFYSVTRPMIADLFVDNDIDALGRFYGTKNVKKSEKVPGAYEAMDYYENLGGQSRYMYFLAAPIRDEDGNILAAIETLQDVSREQELTHSLREYAETLQNELARTSNFAARLRACTITCSPSSKACRTGSMSSTRTASSILSARE